MKKRKRVGGQLLYLGNGVFSKVLNQFILLDSGPFPSNPHAIQRRNQRLGGLYYKRNVEMMVIIQGEKSSIELLWGVTFWHFGANRRCFLIIFHRTHLTLFECCLRRPYLLEHSLGRAHYYLELFEPAAAAAAAAKSVAFFALVPPSLFFTFERKNGGWPNSALLQFPLWKVNMLPWDPTSGTENNKKKLKGGGHF